MIEMCVCENCSTKISRTDSGGRYWIRGKSVCDHCLLDFVEEIEEENKQAKDLLEEAKTLLEVDPGDPRYLAIRIGGFLEARGED